MGKPGEYKGLKEKGRIPTDDLALQNSTLNGISDTLSWYKCLFNCFFRQTIRLSDDFVSTFTSLVRARDLVCHRIIVYINSKYCSIIMNSYSPQYPPICTILNI